MPLPWARPRDLLAAAAMGASPTGRVLASMRMWGGRARCRRRVVTSSTQPPQARLLLARFLPG